MPKRNESDYEMGTMFETLRQACLSNLALLTRVATLLIVLFLLLHVFYPHAVDLIEEHGGFAKTSLTSALALIVTIWLFERFVSWQEEARHPAVELMARAKENDYLRSVVDRAAVSQVDLFQVSGQTVLPFVEHLARVRSHCRVRLLLMSEEVARSIDSDGLVDHVSRIRTTVNRVCLLASEIPGFHVSIRYYTTQPALCAVILNNDIVSLSWSPTYADPDHPNVVRVRGHSAATVAAQGDVGGPIHSFAKQYFELVWAGSRPHLQVAKAHDAGPSSH